jgi:hypothetical protein
VFATHHSRRLTVEITDADYAVPGTQNAISHGMSKFHGIRDVTVQTD